MAERGARPRVPAMRRRLLRAARVFFTPLLPDDYLELIDPLWSSRELRGRIEAITRETADAVTVTIRPGWVWEGHEPGQYLRVGVVVDGVHHWRAYSITSDPGRPDGFISITPKLVETGKVTPYLVRKAHPGTIVRLGGVEGTFTLLPFISRRAFEAVTGRKREWWLVETVGALVTVIGAGTGSAAARRPISPEIVGVAAGSAISMATIDVIYVARRRIALTYLLDAAVQLGLLAALARSGRACRRPALQTD